MGRHTKIQDIAVGVFAVALLVVALQTSAHGHETPPPDPPRDDECKCVEISAEPQNKGKIKVAIKDTGATIKVAIAVPWRGTITCAGAKKGECEGELELSSSSGSWMVNVANDGTGGHSATTVGGELFRTFPGQDLDITCKGKCTGEGESPLTGATFEEPPPSIKKFNTVYEAEIQENDPGTSQTNKHITGEVTLEVSPTADTECPSKKGWKMVLAINSRFADGFDKETSDYDGDGFTNKEEKEAKTDLWDPTSKPTP
jgi:hypothetical protein